MKDCVQEEGESRLSPSSTMLEHVSWLKLCGHRHTTVPVDINESEMLWDAELASSKKDRV